MARGYKDSKDDKISTAFKARLKRMGPREKLRAVVMLRLLEGNDTSGRRQSLSERHAAIDAVRKSAESGLVEVDRVLKRFGGKRLAPTVNALGAVPVETTADAITALAALEPVKAILEEQPISLLPNSKH
ncbi:MAG TPA: hypothetical protein VNP04_05605 [Alphaproteobacteria bacterium]|nr:hypothetical protein [Alphaproteobacteria bacterium]